MADPCFEKKSRSQRSCAVEQQREGILVLNESALEGFGTRGSCIVFIVSLYLHPVSVLKHKPGLNRADLEKSDPDATALSSNAPGEFWIADIPGRMRQQIVWRKR